MEKETKTSTLRWLLALRGALLIAFGLVALFYPGMTILGLVYFFAVLAIINGIIAIAHFFGEKNGIYLLEGAVGIILGILVIFYPGITAVVFTWLITIWLFVVGLMIFVAGVTSPKGAPKAFPIITGILLVGLALFLIVQPVWLQAVNILYVIGGFTLLSGIMLVLFSVFVKKDTLEEVKEEATE
jgi:uncharacterized membrane protein HdeD (DUF308 family)